MKLYLVKRTLQVIPTLLSVVIINFFIIRLAPGGPEFVLAGPEAPPSYVEALRVRLGLDKPLYEQFLVYLQTLLRGDLGFSFVYNEPVLKLILERLPATLLLTVSAFIISVVIGVIFGVIASKKPFSNLDNAISFISLIFYSTPVFWIGLMAIIFFSLWLRILPTQGIVSAIAPKDPLGYALDVLRHLILPASTLSVTQIALYTRLTRASMLEVLRKDFIVTARSKGLDDNQVIYKHALRNALLPVVTIIGLRLGFLVTGTVLVETVFGWPGIGRLMYLAIFSRDYPLLMGIFTITAVCVIFANFLTDILYSFLDPRVKYD